MFGKGVDISEGFQLACILSIADTVTIVLVYLESANLFLRAEKWIGKGRGVWGSFTL